MILAGIIMLAYSGGNIYGNQQMKNYGTEKKQGKILWNKKTTYNTIRNSLLIFTGVLYISFNDDMNKQAIFFSFSKDMHLLLNSECSFLFHVP